MDSRLEQLIRQALGDLLYHRLVLQVQVEALSEALNAPPAPTPPPPHDDDPQPSA
jgi:hypothetical protein